MKALYQFPTIIEPPGLPPSVLGSVDCPPFEGEIEPSACCEDVEGSSEEE